jgi:hypothetical protein
MKIGLFVLICAGLVLKLERTKSMSRGHRENNPVG